MRTNLHNGSAMAIGLLICSVALFLAGPPLVLHYWGWQPAHALGLGIAAGLLVLFAIGRVTGQHVLTDERQRWSLSRLQLLIWTMLLLPSVWTMVVIKLLAGVDDALALGMNDTLWALLGVTATSFVASPMILDRKRAVPGALDARAALPSGGAPGELQDLFRGEDTATAGVVDISRVQMCLFTVVSVVIYFVACWRAFATQPAASLAFPAMSQNLVALLGISHATYLVGKIPNRSVASADA